MKHTLLLSIFFAVSVQANPLFVDQPNTLIGPPRQMTFVGPRSGEGYFSADGKKMIFQSEREPGNPFYQMYLLDLKSGATQRLSTGVGKTTCGWIHPSGKKVMWSSTHLDPKLSEKVKAEYEERTKPVKGRYSWSYDENYDIFDSDIKGKSIRRLTTAKGYDAEGSYSPDGKLIAFASNRLAYSEKMSPEDEKLFQQDASYMMDLYLMNSDGTGVRRLTTAKGYDGGPFFSADGKWITFRRFSPNGATAEIYRIGVDGKNEKQLTQLHSMSWAPFYHPSGDYIIFASSVLGYSNFELFIVDAEGTKPPVRVTFDDGFDGLATFSPDGKTLSWTRRNEKGDSQIYMASWDDALARRLLGLAPSTVQVQKLSSSVNEDDLASWAYWLAAEDKAGRAPGSPEEKIIHNKIIEAFKAWGLEGAAPGGGFLQEFEFVSAVQRGPKNSFTLKGTFIKNLRVPDEGEPYSLSASGASEGQSLVFAGYGIKAPAGEKQAAYDSYHGLDVKGKWVVLLADIPTDLPPERRHYLNIYSRVQHKVTVAREQGAAGVIVIEGLDPLKPKVNQSLRFDGTLSMGSMPVWKWGGPWVQDLWKKQGRNWNEDQKKLLKGEMLSFALNDVSMDVSTDLVLQKSKATNVIARLPSGKASSAVLVGAHGDHLGRGENGSSLAKKDEIGQVHPGADDNASGVAAVMELAHEFSQKRKSLRKDIYFAVWSAEEIGLLGSAAWAREWAEKNHKPLKSTFVASLNLDMVGRLRERLMIQGVGSGDHWPQIVEEAALRSGVAIGTQDDPYVPTDAMTFYMAEIPSLSFFTGAHGEYHSPRDTPATLNLYGLKRVTEVTGDILKMLTDSTVSLVKYQKVAGSAINRSESRSFRIYLGTIPDYTQEGIKGLRISGVSKDSPAEKAGLQGQDVIVDFAGTKIETIYDYVYALQSAKAGEKVKMIVQRKNKNISVEIIPALKE